jgi:hypothetical protein
MYQNITLPLYNEYFLIKMEKDRHLKRRLVMILNLDQWFFLLAALRITQGG